MHGPHVSVGIAIFDTFGGIEHCLFGFKYHPVGWELPGGKVDLGESVAEAAAREVFEETGLIIEPVFLNCFVDHVGPMLPYSYVCLLFGGTPIGGELTLREPDKNREWKWFPCDKFPQPLVYYAEASLLVLSETYYDTARSHEVCQY